MQIQQNTKVSLLVIFHHFLPHTWRIQDSHTESTEIKTGSDWKPTNVCREIVSTKYKFHQSPYSSWATLPCWICSGQDPTWAGSFWVYSKIISKPVSYWFRRSMNKKVNHFHDGFATTHRIHRKGIWFTYIWSIYMIHVGKWYVDPVKYCQCFILFPHFLDT